MMMVMLVVVMVMMMSIVNPPTLGPLSQGRGRVRLQAVPGPFVYRIPGPWSMVSGPFYLVHGIWYLVYGTWYMVPLTTTWLPRARDFQWGWPLEPCLPTLNTLNPGPMLTDA